VSQNSLSVRAVKTRALLSCCIW